VGDQMGTSMIKQAPVDLGIAGQIGKPVVAKKM
jgi:hypothetical protein